MSWLPMNRRHAAFWIALTGGGSHWRSASLPVRSGKREADHEAFTREATSIERETTRRSHGTSGASQLGSWPQTRSKNATAMVGLSRAFSRNESQNLGSSVFAASTGSSSPISLRMAAATDRQKLV